MKITNSAFLALSLVLAASSAAEATYTPALGRWLQRDPLPGDTSVALMKRVTVGTQQHAFATPQDLDPEAIEFEPANNIESPPELIGGQDGVGFIKHTLIDGPNLYQYVRSSPTRYVDPLGLSTKCKPITCVCKGGTTVTVQLRADSNFAKFLFGTLRRDLLGLNETGHGCVTGPDIFSPTGVTTRCTWSKCEDIHKIYVDGRPILEHECGHACDLEKGGLCQWRDGAIRDNKGGGRHGPAPYH